MSISREDVRYQRDLSRAGKARAMTNIRRAVPGPERLLGLADQARDEKVAPRLVSYMGAAHSTMVVDNDFRGAVQPARPRALTAKKKDRVVSDAQALLDQIYGRAPAPPPIEETPPPPPAEEEPPKEENAVAPAEEEPHAVAEPLPEPEPVRAPAIAGWMATYTAAYTEAEGDDAWARRWFTLHEDAGSPLVFFVTADDAGNASSDPDGLVPLDGASTRLVRRPTSHTHPAAAAADATSTDLVVIFEQDGEEHKLLLRCDTTDEHARWTGMLAGRVAVVDAPADIDPPAPSPPPAEAAEEDAPPEEPTVEAEAAEPNASAAPEEPAPVAEETAAAAEEEVAPVDPGPQPIGGWMEKFAVGKSGATGAKNWKRRWFVLPADTAATSFLTYHEKEGGKSKALGQVPVHDGLARLVTAPTTKTHPEADAAGGKDLVVVFTEDKKEFKLLLRCDTPDDHARWAAELRRRVSAVNHARDI